MRSPSMAIKTPKNLVYRVLNLRRIDLARRFDMFNRRGFIGAMATASLASMCGKSHAENTSAIAPDLDELDKAAAAPVLKLDKLKAPVMIEAIKLLKKDEEYLVQVRSKAGAGGGEG